MRRSSASLVLLASSLARARRRWSQALEGTAAIREASERGALERLMATLKPAVLLLDLALPRLGGLRGVPAIRRLNPPTKTLLLTRSPDEREGLLALKAGARGYCRLDIAPALLKKAVERVQRGEIWVGRKAISYLLEELTSLTEYERHPATKSDDRLDRLSLREREIAALVSGGASNREIASRLEITEKTVKAHLTAIFHKLGLRDRLNLALFVAGHSKLSG